MRIFTIGGLLTVVGLVSAAAPAHATVWAWRDGGVLHLSNDPAAKPEDRDVRGFESRLPPSPGAGRADVRAPAPPPAAATRRPPPAAPHAPPVVYVQPPAVRERPIIVAPTIVVRAPAPEVVVAPPPARAFYGRGAYPFATGFIGHEHPQVPRLRGRRLVPHSHFFARGRPGLYTPYGHSTHHGLLRPNVPVY